MNWDAEEVLPLLPAGVVSSGIGLDSEEMCEDLLTLHHHHALVLHSPHQVMHTARLVRVS